MGDGCGCPAIILIILAILFPPLSVGLARGCGKDLCINLLLCLLFVIPGMIHALVIACGGCK